MEKSWDIIVWDAENLIDYIPSSWGNETKTKYKYPTSTNTFKIRKSIDTCTPLNDNFNWLEAVCKAEAVKDLGMAKDLCNKGQYTSNLETADEQTPTDSKRLRKKKKRIYESNDNSTSSEESVDQPLSKLINPNKKSKLNKQIGSYGSAGLIREKFNYEELNNGCNSGSLTSARSSPSNIASTSKISSLNGTPTGRETPSTVLFNNTRINTEWVLPIRNNLLNTRQAENNSGRVFSIDFTSVISEICNIKFEVQEIKKVVDRLENIITVNAVANISNQETNNIFMDKLPCKTTVEIDSLETELMTNKESFKNLVSILYLLGGNTPHKTIYLMMNKIFGKQLALKYSGQGKKKKIPFCGLKMYDAIMAATRKRHPNSTEDGIKKSVALFLATAKSRLPRDQPERDNSQEDQDQETDYSIQD